MITVKIDEILAAQGKTRYWLAKQCDTSQNNMAKICNNETSSIRFDMLEKICKALNCSLTDIIEFDFDNPTLNRYLKYTETIYKESDTK